ncbi:MAG: filamentous hemagglutinin family protein, partial [Methylovulum sp.]|nr:filamentous hemagglutinin family protein [Methylovulum sp.]
VTLVADKGAIALSGTVNTQNATQGGAIELYAGDKITLASGSVLTTTGAKGGDVLLSSVDSDKDGVSGISIKSGASIDVSGSAQGGNVTLRALRDANTVINIDPIAANTVKGAHNYYAEGVQKYTNTDISNGVIDSTTIATIQADTANYMSAANIAKVSSSIDSTIQLRPDVEIDYSGDLKVGSAWDFATWRYGNGVAGNLQISASGQLTVAAPITDGYEDGFDSNFNPIVVLQNGNSWSYQLTAGADAGSADRAATINNVANDLVLSQSVHTGVGDIKLAAGGDVLFTNKNATVYTGGKQTDTDPYGSLISDYLGNSDYNTLSGAEYGVDGGKVVISADHNIQGANSSQFLTDWLVSTGNSTSNIATAWGVIAGNFKQNIGSFGGGDVSVNAGGNINDLSVMMPSTGKQIAPATAGTNDSGQTIPIFTSNEVQVQGGGQLSVHASGDIAGGAYLLGKGAGAISADGQITGGKQFVDGPQLVMGDSTLALTAKQGISITAVSDQMTVSKSTQFYTYSGTSGISVNSLSGDVTLGADTSIIRNKLVLDSVSASYAVTTSVYPANLDATAFGGNIALDTIYLFPSVSGKVSVLAQQGISAITDKNTQLPKVNAGIIMRDIDMSLLPTATAPGGNDPGFATYFQDRSTTTTAVNLLHTDDKDPARIVAQTGDISNVSLVLSKKAIIQAGRDLKNVKLDLQNINATDTTILSAGRDLFQQTLLSTAGLLDLSPIKINYIQLSGPGDLLVKTGRNLDLGISNGLVTRGNELNANLTSAGANITVMSGLNGHDLNYTGFISHYLADYPTDNNFSSVSTLITTFMQERLGDSTLSTADALKLFKNLDAVDYTAIQSKLTALILPVYEKHSNLSYQGVSNADIIAALSDSSSVKYNAMIDKYLQHFAVAEQFNTAPATITAFMRDRTGNTALTDAQALVLFEGLNSNDYLSIEQKLNNALLPIYYNEIKEAGAASASDKTLGNDRAYAAIDTLFPGSALKTTDTAFPWQGDISMAFSTIQTGEGGNINLLVPGGKITAGLSFAFPGLDYNRETNPNGKSPSDLGIIAQQAGDINAFSRSDFLVNLSRVFTQAGGNIAIWSTEGNIDAGRGAKTALTVPETVVSYSTSGKLTIVKPSVAGSGIRAAAKLGSNSGQGDVALFAPGGVVNAGEAGIGGKNVTISATQVLGSNNIQVGGVSTGVPAASVGSLAAGLSGLSNLSASVSQIAQAATETNEKDSEKKRKAAKLGILSVDFLGHGDDNKPKPRPAS